jgi:biotin/lipoate A/B protein ligase family protein
MLPASRVLDLPPPFRAVVLREAGDAFAHASAHALELGAGALVFVGRFGAAEFAVVLEPEEALANARRSFYAGMAAVADALSALVPPEMPITIEWPDVLSVDGALVCGGRLTWPPDADEDAVPDWLVFGAAIRLVFAEVGAERLVEGFARHLMLAIDYWQEGNFTAIAESYLSRLRREHGVRLAIEPTGNLRIARPGEAVRCLDLRTALAAPPWLDRAAGGPPQS